MSTPPDAAEPDPLAFVPPTVEELGLMLPSYEVLHLIASGGMGAVYKARQMDLDRFVAVKVLPPEAGNDAESLSLFRTEARAMAKLNHPNIVIIHDFGVKDGQCYFVMEYVEGRTVHEMIAEGKLTPENALPMLVQVCEALHYAHSKGIIHGDIKPGNIVVNAQGEVKLLDFGLARLLEQEQTDSNAEWVPMGTPEYAAPELYVRGAVLDQRTDIYALGVVYYEMLMRTVPRGPFTLPSAVLKVDARVDEVIVRCLKSEPEHRFQNVSQVRQLLEDIRTGKPLATAASGLPKQGVRPVLIMRTPAHQATPASGPTTKPISPKKISPLVLYGSAAMTFGSLIFIGMLLTGEDQPKPAAVPPPRISSQDSTPAPNLNKPRPEPTPVPTTKPQGEAEVIVKLEHPSDVHSFGGREYQFIAAPISWDDAKRKAEDLGGMLLCINTPQEFEFIVEKILKPTKNTSSALAWVGGHASRANDWQWVSGEPWFSPPWLESQPNVGLVSAAGSFPAWTAVGYSETNRIWGLNDLSDSASDNHWKGRIQGFILEKSTAPPVASVPAPPMPAPPTLLAADALHKRLTEADANFRKALLGAAGAAHTTAVAEVEKKYLGAIERLLAAASQSGKLEESVVYQQEKQRIAAKEPLPS